MKYVTQTSRGTGAKACLFCQLRRAGDDAARLILKRRKTAYLMLNAFPYTTGHLMVVVHRHLGRLADLTAAERRDLWELAALGESVLQEVYHPHGLNVGLNLGRSAGAGIDGHLHLHIVPRWQGDTNFMTTCGGTRVLPEDLTESYRRLAETMRAAPRRRGSKGRKTGDSARRGRTASGVTRRKG
jgi:ATP adenylyltransferase